MYPKPASEIFRNPSRAPFPSWLQYFIPATMSNSRRSSRGAGHHISGFKRQRKWLERERLVVFQERAAHREKFRFGVHASNLMEKLAGGFDSDSDVVHIFFHFLNVIALLDFRRTNGVEKKAKVAQEIAALRNK